MTDNVIIKAMECCGKNPPVCSECGYKGRCNRIDCYDYLKRDALDLINRLTKNNEAYQFYYNECLKDLKKANAEIERLEKHTEMYHELRGEAIKEGIHTLSDRLKMQSVLVGDELYITMEESELDGLVKELTGC